MAASVGGKVLVRCLSTCILRSHRCLRWNVWTATSQPILKVHPTSSKLIHCRLYATSSSESESSSDSDAEEATTEDMLSQASRPTGYMAWHPVDDVYMLNHYPPRLLTLDEALEKLRKKSEWAFCRKASKYSDRTVTVNLKLDMKLEKKKKVDIFQNIVILPHPFKEDNKVLCFTKTASDADVAKDCGADIVGGSELIDDILKRKFDYDHCVATPDIMSDISSLKRMLRKKFPNSRRQSVSRDIAGMIHLYKKGQLFKCWKPHFVNVAVGKLSQPNEHIAENIKTLIHAVSEQKPAKHWPFVTRVVLTAFLLDGYRIEFEHFLPVADEDALGLEEVKL
ncbi:large ribosomal subunit protein uL1m-like [Ptychodera flava]|uniref:large ribosomal subunit protein uL1m-like n=1 Tax=Ptychodera flava TaxID=63121 RepID=UPI00396A5142